MRTRKSANFPPRLKPMIRVVRAYTCTRDAAIGGLAVVSLITPTIAGVRIYRRENAWTLPTSKSILHFSTFPGPEAARSSSFQRRHGARSRVSCQLSSAGAFLSPVVSENGRRSSRWTRRNKFLIRSFRQSSARDGVVDHRGFG